ncbi:5-formyltetrahydrofolate cyclo-ligase [Dysgonomonadaceae bacterium PH5-43]|nr:5-formyltetrahydrofolate cyclo-ligase [Dysgonomonadaceae bacterium PH5-43]
MKREIRKYISNKKKEFNDQLISKSHRIIDILKSNSRINKANNILCYWSMSDEVYTHDFIIELSKSKNIFLPVINNDTLLIRKFTGIEQLKADCKYSILEPDCNSEEESISNIDVVVVPGVAFDKEGGRLGRGKGFYDKLLSDANTYKIGICFDFQILDKVPREEHDVLMNEVISEESEELRVKN